MLASLRPRAYTVGVKAPLPSLVAACLVLSACRAPEERHTPGTASSPKSTAPAEPDGIRRLAIADAESVAKELERIERAAKARDAREARLAYLELRRAWRRLLPIATLLTHSSTLEPPDEADEFPADLGLAPLAAALHEEPPAWEALERSLSRTKPASLLAPGEAKTLSLRAHKLADALNRGVFRWGTLLDGSAGESREEARIDALEGGRALVRYSREVAKLAADPAALERATTGFERWLDAREAAPAAPLDDKLEGLAKSAELGAELRGLFAARGTVLPPPFAPRHATAREPYAERVSVATFPRLPGAAPDPRRAELGKLVFHDKRLSKNGKLSCASCHREAQGFSAGRERPRRFDGRRLERDVPGLLNIAYEPMFFWDGRASTLARQVEIAVESDMGGSWPEIVTRVAGDAELVRRFRELYPDGPTQASLVDALAELERTLIADDTPFDRYVRGDRKALGPEELAGFDVFFGEARCSRCHRLPLTSGAEPPRFTRAELTAIGVPARPGARTLDADRGRGAVTGRAEHEHAFKVPALRRLSRTAPYFHNGGFGTLEEVVDFYAKGSGQGLGIAPKTFDADARSFELTPERRRALLAFLRRGLDDAR